MWCRLCPDVKFPVPVEDTFDALKWVRVAFCLKAQADGNQIATNHESLGADPAKGFVVGGM